MEHKQATTIDKLKIGDRFYLATDKKKEVFQKISSKIKQTNYQTYSHFALPATISDNINSYSEKFVENSKKTLKAQTAVIFLRHANS